MKQKNKMKQTAILISVLVLPSLIYVILVTGKHDVSRLPYYGPRTWDNSLEEVGPFDTIYHKIPSFSFTDVITNEEVSTNTLKGQILIFDFFCLECNPVSPRISAQIDGLHRQFSGKKDVSFVSILLDDTAAIDLDKTKNYATKFLAHKKGFSKWYFVKGNMTDVANFGLEGLLLNDDKSEETVFGFISKYITLVDKEGHIRAYHDGKQFYEGKELKGNIQALRFDGAKAKKERKKDGA